MNAPSAQAGFEGNNTTARPWLWALLGLAVCLVAISRQSVWIDEALTAKEISQPTPAGLWQVLLHDKGSDLQMPLYIGYMWAFARIFGTSEWTMRAANIPWFIAAVAIFACAFSRAKRPAMMLVVLGCPFVWYYLDEARPYAMQFSGTLIVFAALYRLSAGDASAHQTEHWWVMAFFLGVILLCGSSLLGMVWAGAAFLSLPFLFPRKRLLELGRSYRLACLACFVFLVALGLYYLWSLRIGARATIGKTDVRNVIFIGYELFGFGGLGPGRLEIRSDGWNAIRPFLVPLGLYGAAVFSLCFIGARQMFRTNQPGTILRLATVMAAPALVLVASGCILHFRLLERHFTPLLPALLFVLGLGLAAGWSGRQWSSKLLVAGFVAMSFVSCLSIRFAARHQKDDYRAAAAIANAALKDGRTVWWNAGVHGAEYYRVPLSLTPLSEKSSQAIWVSSPTSEALSLLPPPEIIISSKPDMFDDQGAVAAYVRKAPYSQTALFPAFIIWQRERRP